MQERIHYYKCKRCNWQGTEKELESELVDTCIGDEPVYLCPYCGSYEVVRISDDETGRDKKNILPGRY